MSAEQIITTIRTDHEDLARAMKKHSGIRRIVEDLYPDEAHFIYELLQNAEDTGATEVKFSLGRDQLSFEHNGRDFIERDVKGITDIGEGTKSDDDDKIGRFGVGFKAVFAYSETPRIYSPTFCFEIRELVLPYVLPPVQPTRKGTRFEFPFNNPKKKSATAVEEVRRGLGEIQLTTLLFLTHISKIEVEIEGVLIYTIVRTQERTHLFRISKTAFGREAVSARFLRFEESAVGLSDATTQKVSVAFEMELLPKAQDFDREKDLDQQLRIKEAQRGMVSIFFPAAKEDSRLRFHIHAPFVPELSRASIKETPANTPLFSQIASFAAKTLHEIKDLGFLTTGFLGVLPNPSDNLSPRYEPIREAIVAELNAENLTPKHSGGHGPAKRLLQAKAALKELLNVDDLKQILPVTGGLREDWAVAANQRNTAVDRFLNSLSIQEWGADQLLDWLKQHFSVDDYVFRISGASIHDEWLKTKSSDWFQNFYAFLHREFKPRMMLHALRKLRLVRLTDGSLSDGVGCMFVDGSHAGDEPGKWVPRVLYSSGESLNDQEEAFRFLEEMGVKRVGDRERVELLLKGRYQDNGFDPCIDDIKFFINHLRSNPGDLDIFGEKRIFKRDDGQWSRGENIFIDEPFSDTGLGEIYQSHRHPNRYLFSRDYLELGLAKRDILEFAESLGAISHLEILRGNCQQNPQWEYLSSVPGKTVTNLIDQDFYIIGFKRIFQGCCLRLSQLVWDTLTETDEMDTFLVATYRKNMRGGSHTAPSQLVHQLRNTAWVPQKDSGPATPPCADLKLLPDGFAYDSRDQKWIEALRFGSELESQKEAKAQEDEILRKTLGISDSESVEDFRELIKAFSKLPPDRRRKHLDDVQQELDFELPESEPKNPEMRRDRVGEEAKNAPERATEKRERSVSVGRETVKEQAFQYLLLQYTNEDQVMICQICQRELPFRCLDGEYYFESVEFISDINLRHHQNYLALCPNHAAMFKHANASKDDLKELFLAMGSSRKMDVDLADTLHSIYFTETHRVDFAAVIAADSKSQDPPASS